MCGETNRPESWELVLKALKVLQAKMQRDTPQHTHVVQQSRQMVYQVTGAAIDHVYQARLNRQAQAQ
jgi:hypothetical protein